MYVDVIVKIFNSLTIIWWPSGWPAPALLSNLGSMPRWVKPFGGHPGPSCYFWGGVNVAAAGFEGCLGPAWDPRSSKKKKKKKKFQLVCVRQRRHASKKDIISKLNNNDKTHKFKEGIKTKSIYRRKKNKVVNRFTRTMSKAPSPSTKPLYGPYQSLTTHLYLFFVFAEPM